MAKIAKKEIGGRSQSMTFTTGGYDLKAKHIILTVGPIYSGTSKDATLLADCSPDLHRDLRISH